MSPERRAQIDAWLETLDTARTQILEDYRQGNGHGLLSTEKHIFDLASLGIEDSDAGTRTVLDEEERLRSKYAEGQENSVKYRASVTEIRAVAACEHFQHLLSRVTPLGPLSPHGAASRMRERWPVELGKPPSTRTLTKWIKQGSPFPEHKVGSKSVYKKSR